MVAWTFDADMDPETVDSQFGAGPVLQFSGGSGDPDLAASETLAVPDQHVYKPQRSDGTPGLEANLQDQPAGDIVAGQFHAGQPATEAADFTRADFTPFDAKNSPNRDAFLVRMRRTRNASGLDQAAGVSSSGPPLPFLFALGSVMQTETDTSLNPFGYAPRRDGISVRATAIADGRPALFVGPQDADLYAAYGVAQNMQPQLITSVALPAANWNAASGGIVGTAGAEGLAAATSFVAVGEQTTGPVPGTVVLPAGLVIVPLVAPIDNTAGLNYVVGFGVADSSGGPVADAIVTQRSDLRFVLDCSASPAAIGQTLDRLAPPAGVDRTQFIQDLLTFGSSVNLSLFSPVLVR